MVDDPQFPHHRPIIVGKPQIVPRPFRQPFDRPGDVVSPITDAAAHKFRRAFDARRAEHRHPKAHQLQRLAPNVRRARLRPSSIVCRQIGLIRRNRHPDETSQFGRRQIGSVIGNDGAFAFSPYDGNRLEAEKRVSTVLAALEHERDGTGPSPRRFQRRKSVFLQRITFDVRQKRVPGRPPLPHFERCQRQNRFLPPDCFAK